MLATSVSQQDNVLPESEKQDNGRITAEACHFIAILLRHGRVAFYLFPRAARNKQKII